MDLESILGAIRATTNLVEALGPLITDTGAVLSSDDRVKVDAELAKLRTSNDALHSRVIAKLRAAEQG